MAKEQDLRFIRSKESIKKAFIDLLDSIGFEKITVKKLTEKAKINRSTFYLHYLDKYDLLDQIENEILEEIRILFKEMPIQSIVKGKPDIQKMKQVLVRIYSHIGRNHSFFSLIMGQKGDPAFFGKFERMVKDIVIRNADLSSKIAIPEKYLIAMIAGIQTGFVREWLSSGMQESKEEIAEIIIQVARTILSAQALKKQS